MMISLLVLLICARELAAETPDIYWSSDDLLSNVNNTVKLQCAVKSKTPESILLWTKISETNQTITLGMGEQIIVPDTRLSARKEEKDTFMLEIKNITIADSGTYKCSIAISVNQEISKLIRLQVRTPPSILENTTSSITARVNTSAKLECYVSGYPSPAVVWTREDGNLLPTGHEKYEGGVLRIEKVRKEDAGVYYCTARNEVGPAVRKTYKLQVEFLPEIQVAKSDVGQALQYSAELECRITAFPDPVVIWLKNSTQVPKTQHYKISQSTLPNALTVSKLQINTVDRAQYGIYTCKASNDLGEAKQTIKFYETAEPECTTTCGSSFEYPNFKLIFSTTVLMTIALAW